MFKFRLEPALRYRTSIVEKNQRELALVNNLFQQENDKLETLSNRKKNISEKYSDGLENLRLEEIIFYDNFFGGNFAEIKKQIQVVAEAQEKLDEKRAILNESIKQKRIIETVKKKAFEEYKQVERKKEEALLNEVASSRFKFENEETI
jgi:flagellar FliJ protein|tara:strand:+ start:482 stop:928 length:447 start_codon:yes stop_codon:yes gene_type:complete